MNTNNLKKFAQGARKKLLEQVSAKLDYVLSHDSSTLRTKTETLKRLNDELASMGRDALVDKVAYTWFNRLVALRFMDANGFQPMGINVITPISGISPQILEEAHAGHIPEELPIRKEEVMDILDGRVSSVNPDNDAYKILLVASCNQLSSIFPFLFEKINDYTELLLPDDLTSSFSIIKDILNGMSDEDCREVEIIGWLYQFYISEKKDEVFALGERVSKEDIPAATQLFTPSWIVEYMVQNTLGKLWLQNKPNSKLRDHMPYYIESPSAQSEDCLKVNSVEEITLLDQASGSGHILVYGFELFSKIYEEEGYASSEIPQLIIEKNLFGFEIDERAAQLAGFALMMKARSYHRRFFRKEVKPNILHFQDLKIAEEEIKSLFKDLGIAISDELFHDLKTMKQATNFGSLIQLHTDTKTLEETRNFLQFKIQRADIFSRPKIENLIQTLVQLILLSKKYHCIVDNPPYMGSGNMNIELSDFVKTNYPDSKADLMACFMDAGLSGLQEKGFLGMINQHSWMFLSSYDSLREKITLNYFIDNLLHLGPRTFPEIGGEVVQNVSFVIWNSDCEGLGVFFRLTSFDKSESKRIAFLDAINSKKKDIYFTANQKGFKGINHYNIAYWLSDNSRKLFSNRKLGEDFELKQGLATGDNNRFIKFWHELNFEDISISGEGETYPKWHPYNKGGETRKWYGNQEYVVNWSNEGEEIKNFKDDKGKLRSRPQNISFYFKESLTWSLLANGAFAVRYQPKGAIFDINGMSLFWNENQNYKLIHGFLSSKLGYHLLQAINPTLAFQLGNVASLPIIHVEEEVAAVIEELVQDSIDVSKEEWDSKETSWDFKKNWFINLKEENLEEIFDLFKQYWTNKIQKLKRNEEDINVRFIQLYDLVGEISPEITLEEITILKEEVFFENNQLIFNHNSIFTQFLSYSVGCIFGRYALEKEGLILANQGEALEDYFKKIRKSREEISFLPDEDNIIPFLEDTWFEDDIVSRFHEFLKVTFGEKNFRKNLAFVEECLGKDIRKYFGNSSLNCV